MPSIIGGPLNINSAEGVVNFGDTFYISPKADGKTAAGSGAFNTGNLVTTFNWLNATNAVDPDIVDQPSVGNA